MKKLFVCVGIFLCLAGTAIAQTKPSKIDNIGSWLERLTAQKETENLKSYYIDRETANTCEAWNSCAKWALEQYTQDQTFKVSKAQLITQRKVYRHRVTQETHLFVEATYKHRIVRLEFTTPKASGRARPYHYIGRFPQNKPR